MSTKWILFYVALLLFVNYSVATQAGETGAVAPATNGVITIGDAELGVVLGDKASSAEKRVTELLAECINDRSGIALSASPEKAKFRLFIGTVSTSKKSKAFLATRTELASLGSDGYCISVDARKQEFYVLGESASGVVAGVGRLMREMRYQSGTLELPALEIIDQPQMPNRGMYLWARKHFFAKPEQVDRYIEEFALWGGNSLEFWFEMGLFKSFDDPEAQRWLPMYQRFYTTARRLGMKTGLLMIMNDAYQNSPVELRHTSIIGNHGRAHYLCPSQPGSIEKIMAMQEQVFKALAPIDIFNMFPADPGGCSCADCTPWPTRGYWKIAKPSADRIHAISPKTEIWVDTWHLNHPTFGGKDWENLVDSLDWSKERPEWFSGFDVGLAPKHKYAYMSAADRKYYNEAKQPLMVFPDISMWGNHPGMLVNKVYWQELQAELNDYDSELIKGGWPYSERWNTDIASVMFLSWFSDSQKTVDTVLDEYASFYFGSEANTGRKLLELLDDSCTVPDRNQQIQDTLATLESTLPEWVKRDWRWGEIVQSCRRFK